MADAAVRQQAFAGRRIFLIENEISEGIKNYFAVKTLRLLNQMRMMADDDIGAVVYEPFGCLALFCLGPVQEFTSPVNIDDHEV